MHRPSQRQRHAESRVDSTRQHHFGGSHGGGIADAQPGHKAGFTTQRHLDLADLFAPPCTSTGAGRMAAIACTSRATKLASSMSFPPILMTRSMVTPTTTFFSYPVARPALLHLTYSQSRYAGSSAMIRTSAAPYGYLRQCASRHRCSPAPPPMYHNAR